MKDWKGNEIKIGQVILRINFKDMFGGCKSRIGFSFMDANGNPHWKFGEEFINPEGYQWTIQDKFLITEPSDIISICFSSEATSKIPINMMKNWICTQPWQVLAIEGSSDNEKDFFENYFK